MCQLGTRPAAGMEAVSLLWRLPSVVGTDADRAGRTLEGRGVGPGAASRSLGLLKGTAGGQASGDV